MNHFRQRIPNFCTGIDPIEFDFETQDELIYTILTHETLKHYAKGENFSHFAMSDNFLMGVVDGDYSKPIGYLDHSDGIDLPVWTDHLNFTPPNRYPKPSPPMDPVELHEKTKEMMDLWKGSHYEGIEINNKMGLTDYEGIGEGE